MAEFEVEYASFILQGIFPFTELNPKISIYLKFRIVSKRLYEPALFADPLKSVTPSEFVFTSPFILFGFSPKLLLVGHHLNTPFYHHLTHKSYLSGHL